MLVGGEIKTLNVDNAWVSLTAEFTDHRNGHGADGMGTG